MRFVFEKIEQRFGAITIKEENLFQSSCGVEADVLQLPTAKSLITNCTMLTEKNILAHFPPHGIDAGKLAELQPCPILVR